MGTRTRLPDMLTKWRMRAETEAAVAEARRVVERWNQELDSGRDVWWSPTIQRLAQHEIGNSPLEAEAHEAEGAPKVHLRVLPFKTGSPKRSS